MDVIDKNYLRTQFRLRIHEKNATEFQSFFEEIMQAAFPDFHKIRPYGKAGDKGNDGYRPDKGTYYQVYSPRKPDEKEADAARKLKADFQKLQAEWNEIANIKIFYFVYNDKRSGVSIEIERALAELKSMYPDIDFLLFLPKHLEEVFFSLKEDIILSLGFDIDSRNALDLCKNFLEKIQAQLDRDNVDFARKALIECKDIIKNQNDDSLLLEWELLECRALEQLELVADAKTRYENLCIQYPRDPRPLLYLAEIYLNKNDLERNADLLIKAEKIDHAAPLLRLESLLRDLRLNKEIDESKLDISNLEMDDRMKSNFYRLFATALHLSKDFTGSINMIEQAIKHNPDRISNYISKLYLLQDRIASDSNPDQIENNTGKLLSEIASVVNMAKSWSGLAVRNQVAIYTLQFRISIVLENHSDIERIANDVFALMIKCSFDVIIDYELSTLLAFILLPQNDFEILLDYLRNADKCISDEFAKALVIQFINRKTLFSEGVNFFKDEGKEEILNFISGSSG